MSGGISPGTICEWVEHWAETRPDAPVLLEHGREPMTYRALAAQCAAFRAALNGWGYGRGDRVALVYPGGADNAGAVIGLWSCTTVIPLNPDYTAGEFAINMADLGAKAVIVASGRDSPARDAAQRLGLPVFEVVAADEGVAGSVRLSGGEPGTAASPGPAQADDFAHILFTSGTTSRSKIVPIRHRHIIRRGMDRAAGYRFTPEDRCLTLMPLFHAHGLESAIGQTLVIGGSIICMARFDGPAFFDYLKTHRPTWVTASYTFHHAIHALAPRFPEAVAASRLRFIRASSGRLDPGMRDELEAMFRAPVAATYASSESGTVAFERPEPGRRKPGTVGELCVEGAAIMDEDGRILPPGERGEIVVRGEQVFDGYENAPEANAAAFVDGWFHTGDQGVLDEDGYLTLTGRIKEIINRGGEKVSPPEVDAVLMRHHDVAQAVTFAMPHPTLGEEVAAAIILKDTAAADVRALTRFAQQHLAGFKVPRRFVFVDEFPKGPTGKVPRARLAAAFGLDGSRHTPAAPAADSGDRDPTPLEAELQRLWAQSLGLDRVGLDDDYFILGGDSLRAVELFLEIETALGLHLPRAVLFEAGTVAQMAARIEQEADVGTFVPLHRGGDRPALYCAPGRNGDLLIFRALAGRLGADQPVYGIKLDGLDGSKVPFRRLEDMAAYYVEELMKAQPRGPYYLAGYSFGGRLAYAMAKILRAGGYDVALLALLDTYPRTGVPHANLQERVGRNLGRISELRPRDAVSFALSKVKSQLAKPVRRLRRAGLVLARDYRAARRRPLPRSLFDTEEINLAINARTTLTPYDGDVVLFAAQRTGGVAPNIHDGWSALVRGRLEIVPTPGGHYDILLEPHVETLAAELRRRLDSAQETPEPEPSRQLEPATV